MLSHNLIIFSSVISQHPQTSLKSSYTNPAE